MESMGHEAAKSCLSRLAACKAALDTSSAQEPTTTDETEQGHGGVGP